MAQTQSSCTIIVKKQKIKYCILSATDTALKYLYQDNIIALYIFIYKLHVCVCNVDNKFRRSEVFVKTSLKQLVTVVISLSEAYYV